MRVLASVIPGTGHLLPLLPSLHALRDAGDTVLVASAEPLRAEVEGAGLDFAAVGPSWHESDADALLPGFRMAGSAGQLGMFAELAPAVVPDLLASPTTCGRTCSCASRMSSPPGWPLSAPGCRWARCSTPPWTCCAPSSREWLPWTWRCWSPPGRRSTPRCSGPSQPTCTAARFVPQQDVLAAAAAVVCHAGVGTVYGALSVGVPLVVTPLAADPADLRHGLRACRCRRVPSARPATAGVPGLRD